MASVEVGEHVAESKFPACTMRRTALADWPLARLMAPGAELPSRAAAAPICLPCTVSETPGNPSVVQVCPWLVRISGTYVLPAAPFGCPRLADSCDVVHVPPFAPDEVVDDEEGEPVADDDDGEDLGDEVPDEALADPADSSGDALERPQPASEPSMASMARETMTAWTRAGPWT